ncbi:MAG: DUF4381 family protein, partial [Epsilonproteobacteria bacterium]|nr:DUF4381 family protein [Campylobacterota bacterium]
MEQLDKVINQLKDIKEPQFIDTSKEFLIFYSLIAAAILIALFLVWFFLFKKRKRRRKLSKKELALKELKEL